MVKLLWVIYAVLKLDVASMTRSTLVSVVLLLTMSMWSLDAVSGLAMRFLSLLA